MPLRIRLAALAVAALLAVPAAHAEPVVLRLGTIAPQGSGWAREFSAFGRDVEQGTHDAVRIKIYFGGIAGDDVSILDRIRRDQLDGGLASEACLLLAPSLKVTRIFGLFQTREEAAYVLTQLRGILDTEFLQHGFINLGEASLGPEVLFTRQPVRDLKELRATRLSIWELDDSMRKQAAAFGLNVVPMSLEGMSRAYDEKRADGFVAIPTAALAFQWSAQARYLEDVRLAYRNGCLFVASRAFDALPIAAQSYIRSAAGKLRNRLDDLSQRQDDALLGGLFAKQGLQAVPVSDRFRVEVISLARDLRATIGAKLVPPKLLEHVMGWLADYRLLHQVPR